MAKKVIYRADVFGEVKKYILTKRRGDYMFLTQELEDGSKLHMRANVNDRSFMWGVTQQEAAAKMIQSFKVSITSMEKVLAEQYEIMEKLEKLVGEDYM